MTGIMKKSPAVLAEGITLSEQVDLPGAASATAVPGSDLLRTGPAQSGPCVRFAPALPQPSSADRHRGF
jgi:hypothetical protein